MEKWKDVRLIAVWILQTIQNSLTFFWALNILVYFYFFIAMSCPFTECEGRFFSCPSFIHEEFFTKEWMGCWLEIYKQWGCGWLQLSSETNHLIKTKWGDRINTNHFQCGDMPLQRTVTTCKYQCNKTANMRQPVHLRMTLS